MGDEAVKPDIETAIAFYAQEKLKRLSSFLNKTINDVRVIGANSMDICIHGLTQVLQYMTI